MQTLQEDFPSDETWTFEIERWNPAELPLPRTYDLKLAFFGPEIDTNANLMREAMAILRESEIYGEVRSDPKTDLANYIVLNPKHEIIDQIGNYSLEKLSGIGRVLLTGRTVVEMVYNDEPMDINVTMPENFFKSPADLLNLAVDTTHGGVPLKHFFESSLETGLPEIIYMDEERIFEVTADMKETTPKWHRAELEAKARELMREKLKMPDGYTYEFVDTQKDINSSILSLGMALILSFVLIYVVLGAQFNSFSAPVVIMLSIPMGLIGVIASLFLADSTISLNSMLGSILLGGIGVNNSILIYDFFLQAKEKFRDHKEALIHTCELRIIPILITSLTTILGMIPIAFAMGDGTNVIQPLGIAIAGGLRISTILTIFVVPCALNLIVTVNPEETLNDGH